MAVGGWGGSGEGTGTLRRVWSARGQEGLLAGVFSREWGQVSVPDVR